LAKNAKQEYFAGIDIGTSKVTAIIADERNDELNLVGYGVASNTGMRRGAIINLEATQRAIADAVERAELMSGIGISDAFVSVGGGHIKGFNSRGSITLGESSHQITHDDIGRAISAARAVAIPNDREVIHLLPQEFIVDNDRGVVDPLGFSGRRLEVGVHLVTGARSSVDNVIKCVQSAGLEVQDAVLQQFAASLATLSEDEKELGVVLLDVGSGTTDMAVYLEGYLWHTAVLAYAGDAITSDIAVGLRTPISEAESIKVERGACLAEAMESDESIEVSPIGEGKSRVLDSSTLVEIINARLEEIFQLVYDEMDRIGVRQQLNAGIVLTGGTAKMRGIVDLAEQMFEMPARVAVPADFEGIVEAIAEPQFSTAAGLTRFAFENSRNPAEDKMPRKGLLGRVVNRFKNWF
jgi:cell division protein FtsA